jgi:Fe-S-cluster containining protein
VKDIRTTGPLTGGSVPVHGGAPGRPGCGGCTDCCHLPEISITDEEAVRVRRRYETLSDPLGELVIQSDPGHKGWNFMQGPCVFRRPDEPLAEGGCRIYEDRPAGCDIFTCAFLLELRRSIR